MFKRETVYAVGHYVLMLIAVVCIGYLMYLYHLSMTDTCPLLPPGR